MERKSIHEYIDNNSIRQLKSKMTVKTLSWILNKCCFTEFYFHQRILKKLHFIMQHTNCLSLNVTPNQMKCNQMMCCVTCQSDGLLIYIKRLFLPRLGYTIIQMYSWKWKFQLVRLKAILHVTWESKCQAEDSVANLWSLMYLAPFLYWSVAPKST